MARYRVVRIDTVYETVEMTDDPEEARHRRELERAKHEILHRGESSNEPRGRRSEFAVWDAHAGCWAVGDPRVR